MAVTIPPEVMDLIRAHEQASKDQDLSFEDALAEIRKEGGVFGPILEKIGRFFKTAFAFVWSGFRAAFAGTIGIIESFFRFDWLIPSDADIENVVTILFDRLKMDKDDIEHIVGMLKGARVLSKPAGKIFDKLFLLSCLHILLCRKNLGYHLSHIFLC
ncbi:unnamed protein product [marine sediment metagenome]|uniref:Uncharacterized protein n=1 Tax=marine sediment metagenome TaxID=412755 RepID=X1DVU4_9ZZZZ